jgi:hypothetical protein
MVVHNSLSLVWKVLAARINASRLISSRMVALARKWKRKPVVSLRGVSSSDAAARRLRGGGAFDEFLELGNLVENENACALPGCSIVYDRFMPVLRRAMSRGYVRDAHGEFVADGLRHGFSLGLVHDETNR